MSGTPTDIIVWAIIFLISLTFGILGLYDRLIGIVGMIVGMLGGLYILNNNVPPTISTQTTYDSTCSCWVYNLMPQNEVSILMILLGLTISIDFVLVLKRSL